MAKTTLDSESLGDRGAIPINGDDDNISVNFVKMSRGEKADWGPGSGQAGAEQVRSCLPSVSKV